MNKILKISFIVFLLGLFLLPSLSYAQYVPGYTNRGGHSTFSDEEIPGNSSNTSKASGTQNVSGGSGGTSGDIFTILQKKLYDTLKDLRKIVYVISGFGLVMFSVAAIFNKISYKHLGYIMIGLSLLSLMFPFLEYFSGVSVEEVEQKQLAFQNFLSASDYNRIRGELDGDVLDGTAEGQEALSDEELAKRRKEMEEIALPKIDSSELAGEVTGGESGLIGDNPIQQKLEQAEEIRKAGCSVVTMKGEWSENGTRVVCSVDSNGNVQKTMEACNGQVKDGTCQKTAGQVFNDIWKTGQQVVQAGLGVATAWNSAKNVISDTQTGIEGVKDVINSDMGFFDKLYYAGNKVANTWGSTGAVTRDLATTIGGLMGAVNSAGNISSTWASDPETNPSGDNPFAAMLNALFGYGQDAQNSIVQVAGNVNSTTNYGADMHTQANNINTILNLFGLR